MQKKKPGREDLEAFEIAYNAATAYVARGQLEQGAVLLKRAKGKHKSWKKGKNKLILSLRSLQCSR